MKFTVKTAAALFAMVLLGTMATGAYYFFRLVTNLYAKLDTQIDPLAGFAAFVLLLSALAFVTGMRDARRRTIERQLVREKTSLYELIIRECAAADNAKSAGPDSGDRLRDLEKSLALRAGPAVLKAYTKLKLLREGAGAAGPEIRTQFATVLLEMRKDLGGSLKTLEGEDITALLLGAREARSCSKKEQPVDNNVAVSA